MAIRFYLVPKTGDGLTRATAFRAAYVTDLGVPTWAMDYGRENMMLAAADVTPAQHATLIAHADLTAIPANLDSDVGGALATVQAKLEDLKMPSGWVQAGTTYRTIIGAVGRFCLLMQRFDGRHRRSFFEAGITLDTRVNELTAGQRNAIAGSAQSLGLDISFVTGPMTMRNVLKTWVDAMGPFTLAGETF